MATRRRGASKSSKRKRYSESFRRKAAEYSITNGIHNAADKYDVSVPSIMNWRKALGITRHTKTLGAVPAGNGKASRTELEALKSKLGDAYIAIDHILKRL